VVTALKCPNCRAPLPVPRSSTVVCEYCRHVVTGLEGVPWSPSREAFEGRPEDEGRPRVGIGEHRYVVLGRLARGERSDVFLARRDARLTEMVVLKHARRGAETAPMRGEWEALRRLAESRAAGAGFFRRMLPQRVLHGKTRLGGGREGLASVFRWRAGFVETFDDLHRAHPDLDPRHLVWLHKRVLDMLGWVHRSGFVHGAILPEHLLVHRRDHGVALVGWGAASWRHGKDRDRLRTRVRARRDFYPAHLEHEPATPADDLTMSARCMLHLAADVPEALGELLRRHADPEARGRQTDAWDLKDELDATARSLYGRPRYVKL